jgi:hypothetical protein
MRGPMPGSAKQSGFKQAGLLGRFAPEKKKCSKDLIFFLFSLGATLLLHPGGSAEGRCKNPQ